MELSSALLRKSMLLALLAGMAGQACSQSIPIGEILSLTGADGMIAQELHAGRNACVSAINAGGGIHGHQLNLITRDDHGDPRIAVSEVRQMLDGSQIAALLGPVGRPVHDAVLRLASDVGIAVIDPYGGAMASRVPDYSTTFFVTSNFSQEGELIASHLASLGYRDIAVLYTSDDQGLEALAALDEPLSMLGSRRVWSGVLATDGKDAASKVEALLAAHPQALLLATNGTATGAVLKALRDRPGRIQLAIPTYGLSSSISERELLRLGAQARGFIMTQVVPSPMDIQVGVVAKYRAAIARGETATYVGLQGCIDVMILATVLKRHSGDATKASVLRALSGAGVVDVGGFSVDLSNRQQPGSKFTEIVLVDGQGRIRR